MEMGACSLKLMKFLIRSRSYRLGQIEGLGVRNNSGEIVNSGAKWGRSFFEGLGRENTSGDSFDEQFREQINKRMNELVVKSEGFVNQELDAPITPAKIREQLNLLKNWKAGGADGLRNELLKMRVSDEGVNMLVLLLNKI